MPRTKITTDALVDALLIAYLSGDPAREELSNAELAEVLGCAPSTAKRAAERVFSEEGWKRITPTHKYVARGSKQYANLVDYGSVKVEAWTVTKRYLATLAARSVVLPCRNTVNPES